MNKSIIRCLTVGWIGTMGLVNLSQAVLADEPETTPQITVYVYNHVQLEPNTLQEVKEVATRILRNAGVEAVMLDVALSSENALTGGVRRQVQHAALYAHITTRQAANPFGLPKYALGVAPGESELNRNVVYIFEDIAERLSKEPVKGGPKGMVWRNAEKAQILGNGMAHEMGHVLLGSNSHAPIGIMRAKWEPKDLFDISLSSLLFTADEAEQIRAEVARRNQERVTAQAQ